MNHSTHLVECSLLYAFTARCHAPISRELAPWQLLDHWMPRLLTSFSALALVSAPLIREPEERLTQWLSCQLAPWSMLRRVHVNSRGGDRQLSRTISKYRYHLYRLGYDYLSPLLSTSTCQNIFRLLSFWCSDTQLLAYSAQPWRETTIETLGRLVQPSWRGCSLLSNLLPVPSQVALLTRPLTHLPTKPKPVRR